MKASHDCIPCIMKQALNTATRATSDNDALRDILNQTADYVKGVDLDETPADLSNFVYKLTRKITGVSDPYKEDKKQSNDWCLSYYFGLKEKVMKSYDPLRAAVSLAILGNVIDMGIGHRFDIDESLKTVFTDTFAVDDYDDFKREVESGRRKILYLGDNAGEIVFDKILVELLIPNHDVTFVVKRGPIINDSTIVDADYTGISDIVDVIDTGSDGIGVRWDSVSDEFVDKYTAADIVISKGQGNFETMSGKDKNIYFLLRAKCDLVGKKVGVKFGDIVMKRSTIIK